MAKVAILIFAGLSEKEVEAILTLLRKNNIDSKVILDQSTIEANQFSIKNNLRHYSSPSISTHILAIELNDDSLVNISKELREDLLEFGITDKAPEGFKPVEGSRSPDKSIKIQILRGSNRVIGVNAGLQILLFVVISIISYFYFRT